MEAADKLQSGHLSSARRTFELSLYTMPSHNVYYVKYAGYFPNVVSADT
jgi:hypothetical protein